MCNVIERKLSHRRMSAVNKLYMTEMIRLRISEDF